MTELALHAYHAEQGARFTQVNGMEVVEHFGDQLAEYRILRERGGVLDLSFRGRLCLTGSDRKRFLHGQITNNVKDLDVGQGCYAALTTAKGKMQSDLNVYCLADELLLDFEPGYQQAVTQRLEKYIIADDVQVVDPSAQYGLLGVQGPMAGSIILRSGLNLALPDKLFSFTRSNDSGSGELYCMNHPRGQGIGFDLFIPTRQLASAAEKLLHAARDAGGGMCGCQALEMIRIEAALPRFGADMDESNLPPEAGIETRAVSYTKGCYIGQEVLARIRTYGQVSKTLRRLRLADDLAQLPARSDRLFHGDKEAGYITSALVSPAFKCNIALGYVRREYSTGAELRLHSASRESAVKVLKPCSEADAEGWK
jgi:folate-binding protein YgfZ